MLLLKIVLVISSGVFALTLIVRTKEDGPEQKKSDRRVAWVSGILAAVSGFALWEFRW